MGDTDTNHKISSKKQESLKVNICTTQSIFEVREDREKYVRRTRACLSEEPLRSTQKPRADDAESIYKIFFQGVREKTDFECCSNWSAASWCCRESCGSLPTQLNVRIPVGEKILPICHRASVGQPCPVRSEWLRYTTAKIGTVKYAYKYT